MKMLNLRVTTQVLSRLFKVTERGTGEEAVAKKLLIYENKSRSNSYALRHPGYQVAYENLNVASMRFKAQQMNAYLYASNLGHIPQQLEWGATKRGVAAHWVKAAYTSQECSQCHYTARENRPDQRTFRCVGCGHTSHADFNAAINIGCRLTDNKLLKCRNREQISSLLASRHASWKANTIEKKELAVVQLPVQLPGFVCRGSTDAG